MIHVIDLKSNTLVSNTPPDQTRLHGHSSSIIALDCYMDNNLLISVSVESQTVLSTVHNGKVQETLIFLIFSRKSSFKEELVIIFIFFCCISCA